MKKTFIILLSIYFNVAYSQVLYYSAQTGEMTIITDTTYVSTDDNEYGSCSISSTGPVEFEVDPLSIDTSSSETVWGYARPLPLPPETTALASIYADCEWNWTTYDEDTGEYIDMVDTRNDGLNLEVISIKLTNDSEDSWCSCGFWKLTSTPYPESDNITWYVGDDAVGTGANFDLPYDEKYTDQSTYAILDMEGVTWTSESTTLNVPGSNGSVGLNQSHEPLYKNYAGLSTHPSIDIIRNSESSSNSALTKQPPANVDVITAWTDNTVTITLVPPPGVSLECLEKGKESKIKWGGPGTHKQQSNCEGYSCTITKIEGVSPKNDVITITYDNKCGVKGIEKVTGVHKAYLYKVTCPNPPEISVGNFEKIDFSKHLTEHWTKGYKTTVTYSSDLPHNPLANINHLICKTPCKVTVTQVGQQSFTCTLMITNTDPKCKKK